jgi:hypothetical protein
MILAAYGIVFGLVMLAPALRTRGLLKSGVQAEGTVVGAEQKTRTQRNDVVTYYYPRVQFTTPDGRQVVFISGLGSPASPRWATGSGSASVLAILSKRRWTRPRPGCCGRHLASWAAWGC